MPEWLKRLFRPAPPRRSELLNRGLELAMDWGENWLAPIQERLHQQYRHLSREELDELNASCQAAMKFGHATAYELVHEQGKNVDEDEFTARVLVSHPWVDAANIARLFRQSMYYVWKGGGPLKGAG